jgi:hypothetical protein
MFLLPAPFTQVDLPDSAAELRRQRRRDGEAVVRRPRPRATAGERL